MPLIASGATYLFAGRVLSAAAVVSALAIRRRLHRTDRVAALGGRE